MSDIASESAPNLFSGRIVTILLVIALVSFGAVLVLSGWAPELRDRNRAGPHPFSTSAIGYNGFAQYLEALDYPVEISRQPRLIETRDWGLMVLTPNVYTPDEQIEKLNHTGTTLFVLPKWTGTTDPVNPQRQSDTRFADAPAVNDLLAQLVGDAGSDTEIARVAPPTRVNAPFGSVAVKPDVKLQVIRSDTIVPIIANGDDILLGLVPDTATYILADPDMINSFGLTRRENALFAVQMVDHLRTDVTEPIYLDATVHGFAISENLLQMMFDVPFVGATLAALASALMLGWAGLVRFGPPIREARAIALGKAALADNSAGLFSMARRETEMAPGYLALIRRRMLRELGINKSMREADATALLDRLGPESVSGNLYSQMEGGLRIPAANREDLMTKARNLFRWRRDILRRSTHERQ
jgi:hypothetical protein